MKDFQNRLIDPGVEEELLGAILNDLTLYDEYSGLLEKAMFPQYEWLFETIVSVHRDEGLTLQGISKRCGAEGTRTMHQLRSSYFNARRIPNLIAELKKELLGRQLLTVSRQIESGIREGSNQDDVLRIAQKVILDLQSSESLVTTSDPVRDVDEWEENIQAIAKDPFLAFGLITGITDLDRMTTGFHRTDFSVIGARTSMGKTAFSIELILRLNKLGIKCGMFSLEMSKKQLFNRMMANLMRVDFEQFRLGRLDKKYYEQVKDYKQQLYTLTIDDTRAVSADYIVDKMREWKRKKGLDFVIVDYLQDVKEQGEENDNQGSAIGRICRKLRKAAHELDVHVMGLSQIKRDVDNRQDKRPNSSDLSGSTGIETSADVIAMLYRDEYYNPQTDNKGILEVNFTKQRNGKTGKVELKYDTATQRITGIGEY